MLRLLFVMDPYQSMLSDRDTSFAFMQAATARGHVCHHCLPHELFARGNRVGVVCRQIQLDAAGGPTRALADTSYDIEQFDAIAVRKDPPFDLAYLALTHLLEVGSAPFVFNAPAALRDANEKLFALHFSAWMPETLVSSQTTRLLEFAREVGGHAVIKPLDGAGGSGVVGFHAHDRHARGIVDLLTQEGRRLAMVQAFEPAVLGGDKRVLLLEGEILGAIRRVPRDDDIRANIHVGGRVEATELSHREKELVAAVGPVLADRGLYFVGLDLIGEKLIEINVTSPTGVQELARLTGTRPAQTVIEWLERKVQH